VQKVLWGRSTQHCCEPRGSDHSCGLDRAAPPRQDLHAEQPRSAVRIAFVTGSSCADFCAGSLRFAE
jgi:hypothetical protein